MSIGNLPGPWIKRIKESYLYLTDNTTWDVSTSQHGFVPKAPNDATKYLDGTGAYSVPSGGGGNGSIYPAFTAPDNTAFSDVNSPTVAVNANGGVSIISPSDGVRARVKTAPSTPYTITAAFLVSFFKATDQEVGITFRQSSDGKLVSCGFYSNNTSLGIASRDFTSETVVSATNAFFDLPGILGGVAWLKMTNDGTNRILYWSFDGYTWAPLLTEANTLFATADQVGFYARTTNSNSATGTLLSWAQT
jgi:hypothetical protein